MNGDKRALVAGPLAVCYRSDQKSEAVTFNERAGGRTMSFSCHVAFSATLRTAHDHAGEEAIAAVFRHSND
ncbi:hypothetical protein WR30_34480 [Burkholderia contaminans FFH2055]|nr:hypothetical protein WR30_34480 [Burkholderia contaminans FFH2055]RQT25747.1 hypothetical protein DF036_32500 [Burkholderia contaminans]